MWEIMEKRFEIVVCKNFGPFSFYEDTYEEAIKVVKDKWFSPGVWDIMLLDNGKMVDIGETIRSWGDRPVYC